MKRLLVGFVRLVRATEADAIGPSLLGPSASELVVVDRAHVIVQPDTVARWHRAGFRLYWRRKSLSGKSGRPRIDLEIRGLIRRMLAENPGWGSPRNHSELVKLGFDVSERTVAIAVTDSPTLGCIQHLLSPWGGSLVPRGGSLPENLVYVWRCSESTGGSKIPA